VGSSPGLVRPFDPNLRKGPLLRGLVQLARLRPVTWFLINVGNRIDPPLMRLTGGRVRSTILGPTVLLTHTGARTGRRRTTPLTYFTDGDDVVLIASAGGAPSNPAWLHNVRAHPEIELSTGHGDGGPYRARLADGAERERLWGLATALYPGYADYQRRVPERLIPVVICTPSTAAR
jgi:deazaflavin-dependent oxidoreductase (nitroreductase family)